jgi:hypothetical protein
MSFFFGLNDELEKLAADEAGDFFGPKEVRSRLNRARDTAGRAGERVREFAGSAKDTAVRAGGHVREFAGRPGVRRAAIPVAAGAGLLGLGALTHHVLKKRHTEKRADDGRSTLFRDIRESEEADRYREAHRPGPAPDDFFGPGEQRSRLNRARDTAGRAGRRVSSAARAAGGHVRDFAKTPSFGRNVVLPIVAGGAAVGTAGAIARHLRKKREAEKQAGIFTRAPKPGMLSGLASKIPKKKIVAGGLAAAGAYGAGRHAGRKKGEGEAMQVGEQSYEAGARDMQGALMSELGIS